MKNFLDYYVALVFFLHLIDRHLTAISFEDGPCLARNLLIGNNLRIHTNVYGCLFILVKKGNASGHFRSSLKYFCEIQCKSGIDWHKSLIQNSPPFQFLPFKLCANRCSVSSPDLPIVIIKTKKRHISFFSISLGYSGLKWWWSISCNN